MARSTRSPKSTNEDEGERWLEEQGHTLYQLPADDPRQEYPERVYDNSLADMVLDAFEAGEELPFRLVILDDE